MFPLKLYAQLVSEEDENMVFSPYSIHSALSMLLVGCRGNGKAELLRLLDGDDSIHEQNARVAHSLRRASGDVELTSAGRLFIQSGYEIFETFTSDCMKYYQSPVSVLNFKGDPHHAARFINDWIEEQTNRKIKNLIQGENISADTKLILVNAVYFKGKWESPFEAHLTRPHDFYISQTATTEVQMMFQEEQFNILVDQNLGAKILEMEYRDGNVSMLIVLPIQRFGLSEVEKKLTIGHFENFCFADVRVKVPKFRIDYTCSLSQSLNDLGVSAIFLGGESLAGISTSSELMVSKIMHKAFIEVDEEGTEAAAATSVDVVDGINFPPNPPEPFICDHPFLFFIRHKPTNTILFAGRYKEPQN